MTSSTIQTKENIIALCFHKYNVKQGIQTGEYNMMPTGHTNDKITVQSITNC